jgi:cytochrome c biogenesis protein CcmG, thiol:disulfide interchange protein DsbE
MRRTFSALLLATTMVASACSSGEPDPAPPAPGAPTTSPAGSALTATTAALLPTDAFELPEFGPQTFAELLGQLEGTPVLVNVWGSWCPPCEREAPALSAASEEFGERVQFLGIDILDDRESARAFMRDFAWRYPSVFDVNGTIRDDWGFVGQPVTLIFDASGERVFVHQGEVDLDLLRTELRKVA